MKKVIVMLCLSLALQLISSCGFYLYSNPRFTHNMPTIILDSYDLYGSLTRAVRQQLYLNGIAINPNKKCKDIPSLRIISTRESKDTVSIFQNGKTAEYQIVLIVQVQILIPNHDIYPLTVSVFRSFFDNPMTALAKDAEQEIIRKEMLDQVAQKIVRQLIMLHVKIEGSTRQFTDRISNQNELVTSRDSNLP